MTIDLLSPFWGGLVIGIILINIAGILKFAVLSAQKKAADDHISNLISELYSLHKNYKDEIAKIKKRNGDELPKAVTLVLDSYEKKFDKLIIHNKPQPALSPKFIQSQGGLASLIK